MTDKRKVLAICGSTRQNSSNLILLNAIAELYLDKLEITIFKGLAELPHFNPDHSDIHVPKYVTDFRQQLRNADGVLICTPEYAHGVPGTLKNAIDWTVSTNEFSKKPTLLITASTDGRFGHKALLETLRVIEAENIDNLQLIIPFIKAKLGIDNKIKDQNTLTEILKIMEIFITTIDAKKNDDGKHA